MRVPEKGKGRLLHHKFAAQDIAVKADAFFQIAAGYAEMVDGFEFRRAADTGFRLGYCIGSWHDYLLKGSLGRWQMIAGRRLRSFPLLIIHVGFDFGK